MPAAHILHYTRKHSGRSATLREAGYLVEECASQMEMSLWFQAGGETDLVCISESMEKPEEEVLWLARAFSNAPVVLFQVTVHYYAEKMWDLEIPAVAHSSEWLAAIAMLLEQRRIQRL